MTSSRAIPRQRASCESIARVRGWLALGMLGLFLLLQAFATSNALHKMVCADAGHADHHCVITLLAGGSVEPAATVVAVTAFALVCLGDFLPRTEVLLSAVPWHLLPGRAPPRCV